MISKMSAATYICT